MLRPDTTFDTLPIRGTFVVETAHSSYLIDAAAKTAERWPAAPGASALKGDGTPIKYTAITCTLGEPLIILYAPNLEAPSGWRRSATTVESITQAWPW